MNRSDIVERYIVLKKSGAIKECTKTSTQWSSVVNEISWCPFRCI